MRLYVVPGYVPRRVLAYVVFGSRDGRDIVPGSGEKCRTSIAGRIEGRIEGRIKRIQRRIEVRRT